MAPAFSSSPRKPTATSAARRGASSSSAQRGRGSSPAKATPRKNVRQDAAREEFLSSPVLDADLLESEGLMDGDESGLLSYGGGRGMAVLSLEASPMPPQASQTQSTRRVPRLSASPGKPRGRASWGPKASPVKSKLRLLEGLPDRTSDPAESSSATSKKERTLGALSYGTKGAQKARQSIFARPAQSTASFSSLKASNDADEGDDSFYRDRALSSSSSSVKDRVAAMEERAREEAAAAEAAKTSPLKGTIKLPEVGEQLDVQLAEVRRLNNVFSAYEQMLTSSADQIDDFTTRITETNALLDSYIDLMRQTDRTQQLLLDTDWKGVTEDEHMHALAMELAEREQRRRREEAEEAAQEDARQAALEEERARQAAEKAAAQLRGSRASVAGGVRGGRGGASVRGSGIPMRGTATRGRGVSTAATRGRTVSTGTTARAATGTARTVSGGSAGGLNNRYTNVQSSGYGPK